MSSSLLCVSAHVWVCTYAYAGRVVGYGGEEDIQSPFLELPLLSVVFGNI